MTRAAIAGLLVLALSVSPLRAAVPAAAPALAAPPVEAFFKNAQISGAELSPDGRHLIAGASYPGLRRALVLIDLATMAPKILARYGNGDVGQAFWISDNRIAFTMVNIVPNIQQASSGMYAMNLDGSDIKGLAPTSLNQRSFADGEAFAGNSSSPSELAGESAINSDKAFVIVDWEGEGTELGLMNTRSGSRAEIAQPYGSFSWLIDEDGVRTALTKDGDRQGLHLRGSDGKWRKLTTFAPDSPESIMPRAFVGGTLYVEARGGTDRVGLYRYDTQSAALIQPALIAAPDFDINGSVVTNGATVLGYRINTDAESTIWYDGGMKTLQDEVDALLSSGVNRINRGKRSVTPFVMVSSYSPADPGSTLIYNTQTKKLSLLGSALPELERKLLSKDVEMVRYKARDGLSVPAYVTMPSGDGKKNLPTIIFAPTYPWKRNAAWKFDPRVQFLATRGYAVIQPETRGERGFGHAFFKAGNKQWGLAMQNDLADAARWTIGQGIADPKRICIIGTVYGGYAAMMGAMRDPELFQCAVSWAGIVDINMMFKHRWEEAPRSAYGDDMKLLVGDPRKDLEQFKANSPLLGASGIKRPVLLAYGAKDVEVPGKHGKLLFDAIKAGNPDAEFLWFDEQGQPASLEANRVRLWSAVEKFLDKHIGIP